MDKTFVAIFDYIFSIIAIGVFIFNAIRNPKCNLELFVASVDTTFVEIFDYIFSIIAIGAFIFNAIKMASCSRVVKEANDESIERPNWLELPKEVTTNIFHKLGVFEVLTSARQVCSLWWNISKDPLMWRTIDLTKPPYYPQSTLVNICCYAIEQSCGHLEDISIEYFATDEVLKCIANSGSHLRRMRLIKCWAVSNKGLREAVIKLPLLEEFEISLNNVSNDTFAVMGRFCPLLKVLKFNMCPYKGFKCDDDAFAIARNMPNLRHLELMGNWLTNHGLVSILDGCLYLESLNLKACLNIDLRGSLGERCYKQIRELHASKDLSGDDYNEDAHSAFDYDVEEAYHDMVYFYN